MLFGTPEGIFGAPGRIRTPMCPVNLSTGS
jgi:hypothetical protein